jgi:predicted Zn-dependent peptidase
MRSLVTLLAALASAHVEAAAPLEREFVLSNGLRVVVATRRASPLTEAILVFAPPDPDVVPMPVEQVLFEDRSPFAFTALQFARAGVRVTTHSRGVVRFSGASAQSGEFPALLASFLCSGVIKAADSRRFRGDLRDAARPVLEGRLLVARLAARRAGLGREKVYPRALLAIWGDIDRNTFAAQVQTAIGGCVLPLPGQDAVPATETASARVSCVILPEVSVPVAVIGQIVRITNPEQFYALQLLTHILGGSGASRLNARLQDERIAYTAEAEALTAGPAAMLLRVSARTEAVEDLRRIMREELDRLRSEPVTASELRRAIAVLRSRLLIDAESMASHFYRLACMRLFDYRLPDAESGARFFDSASPRTLLELARRLIVPEQTVTVVVSDKVEQPCIASR